MESKRWIKLHDKFLEWGWFSDPQMVQIFILLLLNAAYKPTMWRGVLIERGQVPVGRKSLSKTLNTSERTVRTLINRLKATNEVTTKATNKYTIITICNYEAYQGVNESKRPTKRPTNGPMSDQQTTTTIEDNTKVLSKKERSELFIDHVNSVFGKKLRHTPKVKALFSARINQDGYNSEELAAVIENIKKTTYHIETNFGHVTAEFLLRQSIIEKYKSGPIIQIKQNNGTEQLKGQQYDPETDIYSQFN